MSPLSFQLLKVKRLQPILAEAASHDKMTVQWLVSQPFSFKALISAQVSCIFLRQPFPQNRRDRSCFLDVQIWITLLLIQINGSISALVRAEPLLSYKFTTCVLQVPDIAVFGQSIYRQIASATHG